jgi:hypothetical protein
MFLLLIIIGLGNKTQTQIIAHGIERRNYISEGDCGDKNQIVLDLLIVELS